VRTLVDALNQIPLAGLMLTVALGYLLGRATWRGLSAGPAAGTLFVALGLGRLGVHAGEQASLTIGTLGFCLFVYSVGFEAGPRFFASLKQGHGLRFVAVGTLLCVLCVITATVLGRAFDLSAGATAGMLAGSLTSAAAFAAASDVLTHDSSLSVAFALSYPVGLCGLVAMVQLLTRLSPEPLSKGLESEEELDHASGQKSGMPGRARAKRSPEMTRVFRVTHADVIGRSLKELDLTHKAGCVISLIHRDDDVRIPCASDCLLEGDQLRVTGRIDELEVFESLVGPEVYDETLIDKLPPPRRVHVDSAEATGKTLAELGIAANHKCIVTRIRRGEQLIEPDPEVALMRGDVLDVVGWRDDVRKLATFLGYFEPSSHRTNIAIYAGGIFLGVLVGSVHVTPGNFDFTLGNAGGLLIVGLLLGRFPRIGPYNANVPRAARQLMRDLGILLFVGQSGVMAGASLSRASERIFLPVLLGSLVITVIPLLITYFFARRIMHLRRVDAWGSICGGMTSSAALQVVNRAADSHEPAISYAAAYAVASVLVTLAGQVVVLLMQ